MTSGLENILPVHVAYLPGILECQECTTSVRHLGPHGVYLSSGGHYTSAFQKCEEQHTIKKPSLRY